MDSLRTLHNLDVTTSIDASDMLAGTLPHLLSLLRALLPPANFVDPVVQRRIQLAYWRQRLQVAEAASSAVDRFFQLTLGRAHFVTEHPSQHPLMLAIDEAKQSAVVELEKLLPGEADYYRHDELMVGLAVEPS